MSGRESQGRGGEMLIVPACEPHPLRAVKPFNMLLVMICQPDGCTAHKKNRERR